MDPLNNIDQALCDAANAPERLADAQRGLQELTNSAQEAGREDIASCASLLNNLLEIAVCSEDDCSNPLSDSAVLIDFLRSSGDAFLNHPPTT